MKGFILMLVLMMAGFQTDAQFRSAKYQQDFNPDWKFHLGDVAGAEAAGYKDGDWRKLSLPHDWSIEHDFSLENPATPGGGALPGGIGWYRKSFTVSNEHKGRRVYIDFDGIYMNSTVWVNGKELGHRPNGYISFRYDMTPHIIYGGQNVIAVKVDNSRQPNSRWYSGSGIYRKVTISYLDPVHVDYSGSFITTPEISANQAKVRLELTFSNYYGNNRNLSVHTRIRDRAGRQVAEKVSPLAMRVNNADAFVQELNVPAPQLWSTVNPNLYMAETTILQNGKVLDEYHTRFGIRSIHFDADSGFYLNGQHLKILGVCNHHDLGCLGSAVNKSALQRQLRIMQEMGVNAIRTAHNPPARELLELCDEMGLMVMDEMFDMWRKKKSPYDYATYFPEWHERDLRDFIKRDRNHPSIIMWSTGNEVLEQWSHIDADTLSLQQANLILNFANTLNKKDTDSSLHVNALLALKLSEIVRSLDTTRPITTGNYEPGTHNHLFRTNAMDVIGINYHEKSWPGFHDHFPGKKLIITESTSGLMSRGFYLMPGDSSFIWPVSWDQRFERPVHQCSSYDHSHVPWGTTHAESWKLVKKYPHIAGMFVWTGFDYLGEPTPFWWPSRSSYFGIVDLAGFPKDVYYMYKSEWSEDTVLHIFPHWSWKAGDTVDIWAYYNQGDEVELFLNGRSLGIKKKAADEMHVFWRTVFTPGTLKAVSRLNGKTILEKEIQTAGKAVSIRLKAQRTRLDFDDQELGFITAEVVDQNGILVPDASHLLQFSVEGSGRIFGTDNGDPTDSLSLSKPQRRLFNGKALAVAGATAKGAFTLKAEAEGLRSATISLQAY